VRPCMHAGSKAVVASLTADHLERDVDVAARRMRVGTDFLVCFPHERGEIGLSNALILDVHLQCEPKTTVLAHADRCRAVTLDVDAYFFFCLATKSSEPPKQAA
jgi:hypothetical protein